MDKGEKILTLLGTLALGLCIILFLWLFTGCTPMPAIPPAVTQTPSQTPAVTTVTPCLSPTQFQKCAIVTARQSLNVRTGPGLNNPVIGYLAHDDLVNVIGYQAGGPFPNLSLSPWWKIRTPAGVEGWARSIYLNSTTCETGE